MTRLPHPNARSTLAPHLGHHPRPCPAPFRFCVVSSTPAVQGTPGPKGEGDAAKSSMVGASFNFINSIVGAGIVGMPFALRQAGFGFGIVLILLMGWLTGELPWVLRECGLLLWPIGLILLAFLVSAM